MYKSVYDLTPEQLSELKWAYFFHDEPEVQEILEDFGITYPDDIPDDIIYQNYEDVCFVDDDFSCTECLEGDNDE